MKFDPRLGEIGAVGANSRRIVEVFDRIIGEPDVFDGNTTDLSEQDGGQLPKLRPSWVQQQKRFVHLLWMSGEAAGQFQLYTQELTGFICKAIQSDSSQSAFQEVIGELGNYVKDSGNPSGIASALANVNSQFSIFQQLEPPINSVVEDVHDIRQRLCNFSGIWSRFTSDSAKIHLDLEELTKPLSDTDHTTHATLRIKAVLRSTKDLLDKLAVQFAEYVAQVEHSGVAADLSATLAAETVGIYESFRQINFAKLDSAWQGRWDALILSYFGLLENINKITLTGSQYLADFDVNVIDKLEFKENRFWSSGHRQQRNQQLLSEFIQDPRGDQLQKMFERLLSGFATLKTEVSVFSKEFSEVATKERNACRARLQELRKKATQVQDKITGSRSKAMSVEKLLRQVPGVNATPVLPWIIAQGLSSVGISDLEQARQWLVQTFNAETELQDKKSTLVRDSVALEARSTAFAHAQNALTMLTLDFVDIAPRVERFAEAWGSAQQDIRSLATGVRAGKVDIKKNLSTRVKDVGEACRAVRRAMEDYYWDVEVTGVLKNSPPEVVVTLKSKL